MNWARRQLRFGTGLQITGLLAAAALLMGQGCPVGPPAPDPGTGGNNNTQKGAFVGANDCKTCHSNMHNDWATTAHAGALETLKAIGQDQNAACLPCHTVGFGQEGGFVDEATTPHLAGVQCESCHEAGLNHVSNAADKTARPPKSIAATVCGKCHNDAHHPTFDEWSEARHAVVTGADATPVSAPASYFSSGRNLSACGVCHSGDFRQAKLMDDQTVSDSYLAGKPVEEYNAITCAVCHEPHRPTGNNVQIDPAVVHESQLRYPEVATPVASNSVADAINPERFNLCGQCHHSRDKVWTATDRGPHHSVQANMYLGEMPVPDGTPPLLPNERTVHRFVPKQCVTCHMRTDEFVSEEEPAEMGHGFVVKTAGCTSVGCHPTEESAAADMEAMQASVTASLGAIAARLGPVSTWEYSAEGGGPPASAQAAIPAQVKKVRFMYHYILSDGSLGVHNPEYVRSMLAEMDRLLKEIGK